MKSYFHSGGQRQPLTLLTEFLAVRGTDLTRSAAPPPGVSAAAAQALAELGMALHPRRSFAPASQVVGVPVLFGGGRRSLGVLTGEVVIGLAKPRTLPSLEHTAGLIRVVDAGVGSGIYLATFSSPIAALQAANAWSLRRGVRFAHPNFVLPKDFRTAAVRPGAAAGRYVDRQWHLFNQGQRGGQWGADIKAFGAWAWTMGAGDIKVAVLDGGFEIGHPGLRRGIWTNPGEIPANGIDDDRNGFVDDVHGWNFAWGSPDLSVGATVDHGTAVAGVIAARPGDGSVMGTCPRCTILPIGVAWTPLADAAAFHYAAAAGASVISCSWGYLLDTPVTDIVREAIADVANDGRGGLGIPIVFAMTNFDEDDCAGQPPDISALADVIAVSAADDRDQKVANAGFGHCLKILAPSRGEGRPGIATTDRVGARGYNSGRTTGDLPDPDYTQGFGGTSAATPMVAGVLGLMLSVRPALAAADLLTLLIVSADKVQPETAHYEGWPGHSQRYGYGRLNAAAAVQAAALWPSPTPPRLGRKKPGVHRAASGAGRRANAR